jgi:hypothetical protein
VTTEPQAGPRRAHRIEIGQRPDILARSVVRQAGGTLAVRVPRFSDRCVCCSRNADAECLRYHPGDFEASAESFDVPLCRECQGHGLIEPLMSDAPFWTLSLALLALGFAVWSWRETRELALASLFLVPGVVLLSFGLWRWRQLARRRRAITRGEHHGDFALRVSDGVTTIQTTNEVLVADLLARNADARDVSVF